MITRNLCVLLLFLAVSVHSQEINKAKLDSLFDAVSSNNKGMGSLAISQNGKTVYQKAIGNASISPQGNIPATIDTRYRIGSITKTFTAVLIFQLIEQNKLSLSATIDKYFPKVPNANKITIAMLLGHRSGIYNFTNSPDYTSWETQAKTPEQMLEIISSAKTDFEPDTKTVYSNSNYVLLGQIIEKISKKAYRTVLDENIIKKIGLKNTYYGKATDLKNNESYSYNWQNGGWKQHQETHMSIPYAAGAIVSTPTDLTLFFDALFNGKLVSESSLDKMKTIGDRYGMGLAMFPFGTKRSYGHTGGIDNFAAMASYFPDDKMAIAYTTNGVVYPTNSIMLGVLSIYYNRPYIIPSFKTVDVSIADLDQYTGLYSSTQMPLKITVTRKDETLFAQAEGQGAIPLAAVSKTIFTFDQAGISMEFNPANKGFILKQGGQTFEFIKE